MASRPAPILTTTNAGISQSSADKDAPRPLKRSNAKGKVAMPDADPEDVQARNIELLARVPNTSRRKVPALPESLVESESDDEPPPPKIKKRVQVNATRSKNVDDPNAKEPTTTSSARSGASSTRGREEQAVTAQLAEHEPELDDQTEDPVDNEEMMAPKVKRPGKRAVEEAQDTSSGASRKRGRGKQAAAPPTEGLDEPLQDQDEPPAPPRKRAKQTAAPNVSGLVDAPEEDLRESDDIQEKSTAKPRSKPASRTRKAPARFVAALFVYALAIRLILYDHVQETKYTEGEPPCCVTHFTPEEGSAYVQTKAKGMLDHSTLVLVSSLTPSN